MAKRKTSKLKNIIAGILCLVLGLAIGFVFNCYTTLPDSYEIPAKRQSSASQSVVTGQIDKSVVNSKDLSIHFLELGNKYTGDCTLVKVGDTEMLIDAGSKTSSIETIKKYVDTYCTDGTLEYVVVTHAHEDHYAGFSTSAYADSLLSKYTVGTIIQFAQTNKTTAKDKMFKNYTENVAEAQENGTNLLSASECLNQTYTLGDPVKDVSFEILDQKFYHAENKTSAGTENNFSVCLQITQGENKYLFTGDLEAKGEASLVELNSDKLGHVELYKAGHHGSKTSSSKTLMDKITPSIVCVCCCAGSSEYTSKNANQFPTQEFVDRVSVHTSRIYVTSLCLDYKADSYTSFNGNIVVCSNLADTIAVYCSNNTTVLKDTDWFKNNRTLPAGAAA